MVQQSAPFLSHSMTQTKRNVIPRLPLEGSLDLTYRCNNDCLHCWLRIPPQAPEEEKELTFEEIKAIIDQARAMGTRRWSISGGEPMLRPDFPEIFDYLTRKAVSYSLNTNGRCITPEIAQLLKRKGSKMVALYGATDEVHDRVTRQPGSFQQTMRGFSLLKEAGAGFTVQLIPMRANWSQWPQMIELAQSLSRHWRVGAPWLYLSACHDEQRNVEINRQRLDPADVIALDTPAPREEGDGGDSAHPKADPGDDRLFARCITGRRDFHIDPYGGISFCSFLKDPAMRYDLRRGSFQEAWERFIPSLADRVRGGEEYRDHCGSCEMRSDCRWCPVYGWLEHGRFSAPVEHLCAVAEEARRYKQDWQENHRRYYRIAEITIEVESDLPITDATFDRKFEAFRAKGPGEDTVHIRHHFSLPDLHGKELGREVYRKPPWAIYQQGESWIYLGISPQVGDRSLHRVVTFNHDHSRARIYNDREETFRKGGLHSLTLFPSDQILIARLLADRNGCYLHSAGAILDGAGVLFVGHSEAGKSTITQLLLNSSPSDRPSDPPDRPTDHPDRSSSPPDHPFTPPDGPLDNPDRLSCHPEARSAEGSSFCSGSIEILCDDRNIVRRRSDGWRAYGTWSHGDVPVISPASAPLRAICFIEKADENRLIPLSDRKEIRRRLLACLIKPFVTADWWNKSLDLIERMAGEVSCYEMRFDRSGAIVQELRQLIA